MRMEKVINLVSKLKKLLRSSVGSRNLDHEDNTASSTSAIRCEDLFLPSTSVRGHRKSNNYADDPFIAAHTAAQNHFALRPNIYI
ncbi:hypothetical protein M0R45_009535 [Rubus argutus]|uniref:Uncharacterized protein n=1 Tax=Rubus argutus TaxID=59490 RepID=A0AAW1Y6C7_RUBAR